MQCSHNNSVFKFTLQFSHTQKSLTNEGVESNPGPRLFAIRKVVQASHHQGDNIKRLCWNAIHG